MNTRRHHSLALLEEPPLGDGCPSHFTLDRHDAGELEGELSLEPWPELERERAQGRARLEALLPRESFIKRLEEKIQGEAEAPPKEVAPSLGAWARLSRWIKGSYLAPIGLAFAALCLVILPTLIEDPQGGTRLKGLGGDQPLTILRLEGEGVAPLGEDQRLRAGDRIQFLVRSQGLPFAMVINLDDEGRFTAYFPDGAGQSIPLEGSSPHILDGAIELDDFQGRESVVLLLSDAPLEVAAVQEAAEDWADALGDGAGLLPVEDIDLLPYLGEVGEVRQSIATLEKE